MKNEKNVPEPPVASGPKQSHIWFWFGVKGQEMIWERWDKKKTKRWLALHPGFIAPAGSWERVGTGHYLSKMLGVSPELQRIAAKITKAGGKNLNLRELFGRLETTPLPPPVAKGETRPRLGDVPGPMLTLIGLYKDCPTVLRDKDDAATLQEKGPLLKEEEIRELKDMDLLMFYIYLSRCEFPPLPATVGNALGWFVAAPDEITAAAWELALMFMHNIKRVRLCARCSKVFHNITGSLRLCPECRASKPKRTRRPTDRSRLLNLLAAHVKRGKITEEQRKQIKARLQADSVRAARNLHNKILGSGSE